MTQTITVFYLSPANFCNILMTGAKKTKSDPRVMRGHDLTKKKTMTKTNTKTKTKTMPKTNTFREHPQGVILETCDL